MPRSVCGNTLASSGPFSALNKTGKLKQIPQVGNALLYCPLEKYDVQMVNLGSVCQTTPEGPQHTTTVLRSCAGESLSVPPRAGTNAGINLSVPALITLPGLARTYHH